MSTRKAATIACRNRRHLEGVTLIEMMIVIVLLVLVATGIVYGIGALTRSELRKGAVHVVAQAQYAYNYAVVNNKTVRLVFDFESNEIVLQEAHGRVTLTSADDPQRMQLERADEETDTAAVDPWAAATARLEEAVEPSFGGSPFTNIRGRRPQPIGDGISVVRLYTPHEPDPRETGTGAIYFFPSGMTEDAIVQLSNDEGETVYSIELHRLTGRAKVHTFPLEPSRNLAEEFSEVEDS